MIERITPEEVVKAYQQTGLQPTPIMFLTEDGRACALTALAVANGRTIEDIWKWNAAPYTGIKDLIPGCLYSEEYLGGFVAGFDGMHVSCERQDVYATGYKDGCMARDMVERTFGIELWPK